MKVIVASVVALLMVSTAYAAGGLEDVDAEKHDVIRAATIATRQLTEMMNGPNHLLLEKVHKAQVQVVAGLLYHLSIEVRDSGCPKTAPLLGCDAEPKDMFQICRVKVLSQPWLHVTKIVGGWENIKCYPVYH